MLFPVLLGGFRSVRLFILASLFSNLKLWGRVVFPCIFPEAMPILKVPLKQSVTSCIHSYLVAVEQWTDPYHLSLISRKLHHVNFVSFNPCKFHVKIRRIVVLSCLSKKKKRKDCGTMVISPLVSGQLLLPLSWELTEEAASLTTMLSWAYA